MLSSGRQHMLPSSVLVESDESKSCHVIPIFLFAWTSRTCLQNVYIFPPASARVDLPLIPDV